MVWVTFCRHTGQTRALFFAGQDASTQVEQSTWPQGMSAVSRARSKQKGHSSAWDPPNQRLVSTQKSAARRPRSSDVRKTTRPS